MAVNKVVMNTENGAETLIDLTEDTVTAETLAEGVTAHDASGQKITGTMEAGGGGGSGDAPDASFAIMHPDYGWVELIPFKTGMTWQDYYDSLLNGVMMDVNIGAVFLKIDDLNGLPAYCHFDDNFAYLNQRNFVGVDENPVNWEDEIQPFDFSSFEPLYQLW